VSGIINDVAFRRWSSEGFRPDAGMGVNWYPASNIGPYADEGRGWKDCDPKERYGVDRSVR